jgi:phospholipase C
MLLSRVGRYAFAICAVVFATGCGNSVSPATGQSSPDSPRNVIQHVVIIVQENRSFDNLFAGFPGADTAMQGLCKPAPHTGCRVAHEIPLKAIPLAEGVPPSQQGAGKDICHSHQCFKLECDLDRSTKTCRNDGFNLINFGETVGGPAAKLYPYAYVRRSDVAAYWKLAQRYAIADKMFFTETASSFIAHQEILSGTVRLNNHESLTDEPGNTPWGCDAPKGTTVPILFSNGYENTGPSGNFPCFDEYGTIADLLDAKNVSWRFYTYDWKQGAPHYDFSGSVWNGFDAIHKIRYGPDWKSNVSIPNTKFFSDVGAGTLPSVSYVIPTLADSDHPGSGCDGGPRWVTSVVNAIGKSPYWKNTAIVLLWDDWGGWFDNVAPPQVNYTSLGFRVPMVVVSPYAKQGYVSHTRYNFGSILQFVEQTFDLGTLGTTDVSANSMDGIFNFNQTPASFHENSLPPAKKCAQQITTPREDRALIKYDRGAPD